jgi:acyl-CoA thioesterase FadM
VDELLCTGQTTLVFVDMKTNKMIRCPQNLMEIFAPFFEDRS